MKALASFSAFVGKTFAIWVILFAVLGFVMPAIFKQLVPWIVPLLGIIMFGMGLTISGKDFAEVARRPGQVAIGVVAQFVIMPLLAVVLTHDHPDVAGSGGGRHPRGLLPGRHVEQCDDLSRQGRYRAVGGLHFSVTTLLAPVVTPFLVLFLPANTCRSMRRRCSCRILKMVILPLALGFAAQKLMPGAVQRGGAGLPLVSVVGIVLIVAAVVGASQARIAQTGLMIFAVVVLHNGLGYLFGYFAARATGMSLAQAQGDRDRGGHAELAASGLHWRRPISRRWRRCPRRSSGSGTISRARWWPISWRATPMAASPRRRRK